MAQDTQDPLASFGRPVTIEHDESLSDCDTQLQSPLFSMLPREIRDLIWVFATAPVEDDSRKYEATAYYCRPGHRARHKTYTDLLRTCRRVWLEANAFPMLQAEHCFWYYREAPDHRHPAWMASLTKTNRRNFGQLHLFAQMFAIEGLGAEQRELRHYFLRTREQAGDFQPRIFHVTIRHTDWWNWEDEAPLRFEDDWFQAMLDTPDLRSTQTLKLELETLDYKVNQLMPIVQRLTRLQSRRYETHVVDGQPTETLFDLSGESDVYTWTGPAEINGDQFDPYEGKTTLNYHVVILTWRLRFPDIPRAHVPELRRAPRIDAPTRPRDEDGEDGGEIAYGGWLPQEPLITDLDGEPPAPKQRHRKRQRISAKRREKWFGWLGREQDLLAMQRWRDEVRMAVERHRAVGEMTRARWAAEGSLMRFESS